MLRWGAKNFRICKKLSWSLFTHLEFRDKKKNKTTLSSIAVFASVNVQIKSFLRESQPSYPNEMQLFRHEGSAVKKHRWWAEL